MTTSPPGPLLLDPANFTPRARTPWGGARLPALKSKVIAAGDLEAAIGESWEVSVDPRFPSRLSDGRRLDETIASDPGPIVGSRGGSLELLVKLLDAAAPLSVQIHPRDDDPALGPDESGKPEAWYVIDHAEGAGVYFGLADGVDAPRLRRAVEAGEDVSRLLRFHPVARGDFFLVDPGVPHAVGPGVFVVEPQRVRPGRHGVTYRYWDWNRRYDADGCESPDGAPRELHLERALAVTDFERPRGAAFDASVKRSLGRAPVAGFHLEPLSGLEGGLPSRDLEVSRLSGTGAGVLPPHDGAVALTCVRGSITWEGGRAVTVPAGRTALLPASLARRDVRLDAAEAILSAIPRSRPLALE